MEGPKFALGLGVAFAGTSVLLFYLHKRKLKRCVPTEGWQYAGTLEEIMIYPIKSCRGIELQEAVCKMYGIEYGGLLDRMFILVDDEDRVGFAGRHPQMLKIATEILCDDELLVTAPGMDPIMFNISQMIQGRKEAVKCIEGIQIPLIECGAEYGNWFSKFLLHKDHGFRLFVNLNPVPKKKLFGKNLELNPFMVISDESVSDLNARLPNKVHHWQFRANFLINTYLPAFAEDNWKWMRIGNDAVFRYMAPCYRCILPNIDAFTCERSPDFEPVRTLNSYRKKSGQVEPEMGIYFKLYSEGVVRLGDPVFFIS